MKEQDRKIVEDAKRFPRSDFVESLISVIDRLDKQLTEIVEAGEPFAGVYRHFILSIVSDERETVVFNAGDHPMIMDEKGTELQGKHFRRLAQAMKEVKDE